MGRWCTSSRGVLLVISAVVTACSGSTSPEGAAATTRQPIVGGIDSIAAQDAVVLVIHAPAAGQTIAVCSGTLLAPRLVLTARHCVAATDAESACTDAGVAANGGAVHGDYDPKDMYVFAGAERPTSRSVLAASERGEAILDDGSTTLCNHDLALIVLATPITSAPIAPVRLDGESRTGEPVTLVGWGITSESTIPSVRQQREGQAVLGVGPSTTLWLGPAELAVGEGACEGDSGGPALAASGAVIGALSRGGNGTMTPGAGACLGGTNVYTMTSGFRDLVLGGYEQVGQEPWFEGEADPRLPHVAADAAAGEAPSGGACVAARPRAPARDVRLWPVVLTMGWLIARARRSRRSRRSAPATASS